MKVIHARQLTMTREKTKTDENSEGGAETSDSWKATCYRQSSQLNPSNWNNSKVLLSTDAKTFASSLPLSLQNMIDKKVRVIKMNSITLKTGPHLLRFKLQNVMWDTSRLYVRSSRRTRCRPFGRTTVEFSFSLTSVSSRFTNCQCEVFIGKFGSLRTV